MATRIAGYEARGETGRGGMAVVHRARDPRPDRTVALKPLDIHTTAELTRPAISTGLCSRSARQIRPAVAAWEQRLSTVVSWRRR